MTQNVDDIEHVADRVAVLIEGRVVFEGPVAEYLRSEAAGRPAVKAVALILRKDLLVLRRSPALAGVLVAYPLVIALLIGLTAAYANAKPRVALVDLDGIPHRVTVAGKSFDVDGLIDQVAKNVEIVRMPEGRATNAARLRPRRGRRHRPGAASSPT